MPLRDMTMAQEGHLGDVRTYFLVGATEGFLISN